MNKVLDEAFQEIVDLSTMAGENPFKIRAYSNALKTLQGMCEIRSTKDLSGKKGFGPSTTADITQILNTGTCDRLERLRKSCPPKSIVQFQKIPGVGPKTAIKLWEKTGATNLEELAKHKDKLDPKIANGIEFALKASKRTPIGYILPVVTPILKSIQELDEVLEADFAGSLRRRQETIRDVDILVKVEKIDERVRDAVRRVLSVGEIDADGDRKIRARINDIQIDILFVPQQEYGAALQYFTGSKEHNIELRKRAIERGWRLNEKCLLNERGEVIAGDTEESVYRALGVPMLPPELRQDGTEVGKSVSQNLIIESDVVGLLHNHTNWSDGGATLEEIVDYAWVKGLKYIAITDHTPSMAIANGLSAERWYEQKKRVDELKQLGKQNGIVVLHSAEMDVLGDGTCDYPDDLIAKMDFILLALHRQPRVNVAERFIKAIRHLREGMGTTKTIILAHPSGRQFRKSEIAETDWGKLFDVCAQYNVVLEINSLPERLDLDYNLCKLAKSKGCKFSISTDSHAVHHMEFIGLGVNVARRAWLEKDDVINTRVDLWTTRTNGRIQIYNQRL